MTQRIYLTGCTGQVGSRLTKLLLNLGYEVFGIRNSRDCRIEHPNHNCKHVDLLNSFKESHMEKVMPDILVHTVWTTDPKEFWSSNRNLDWLNISKKLIEEFELIGGKYLVVTGSCAEYSWNANVALNEDSLESPTSLYGKSKLELLNWIRERNLPFLWTRTFFQYGMNESPGRLIPNAIDAILKGRKFEIKNAEDIRDFVFVEDVSRVLALLIEERVIGIVNIGSGISTSVDQVIQAISEIMGPSNNLLIERNMKSRSVVVSDSSRLYSRVGNFLWTPLEMGLAKTIQARGENN